MLAKQPWPVGRRARNDQDGPYVDFCAPVSKVCKSAAALTGRSPVEKRAPLEAGTIAVDMAIERALRPLAVTQELGARKRFKQSSETG